MGMDVYGKAATAEAGEYFRRSVWGWRPLADCVTVLAPEETAGCKFWHSNDGDGLDAAGALALAQKIAALQARGMIAAYVRTRDDALGRLPDEPCRWCNSTGTRSDDVGVSLGMPARVCEGKDHPRDGQAGWCNGCDGRGTVRPHEASYGLGEDDVEEFRLFLLASGGFEIF